MTEKKKAIQSNSDVASMKRAIWFTLDHCTSSEAEPKHDNCPTDSTSYCFYQRALAKNRLPFSMPRLQPTSSLCMSLIYDDLRRCNLGKTQNANKSIHSIITARCPKHVFVLKRRLDVAEFNMGSLDTRLFVKAIELSTGK
ncbi:hypothetical protein PoB_004258900 [Plakobranchus ocellatus]|uniref:Uncharacterized protein n=1 Tax=Plakobranchus ocellatus TaxID=259542 RepID=A0AAV4B7Q3_9GAST|nr:hypothetical protein PoB_004258900 [Plakobranchus ocellatus]